MQRHRSRSTNRWCLIGLAAAVVGCGGFEAREGGATGFPETATRLRNASPVTERGTTAAAAALTQVSYLDVDSRGLIYVPDAYQHRVVVFGADGQLLRSFGRRGAGPNEFRAIRGLQVLPGDSVLVYDPALGRISVFPADSDEVAYTVNLAGSVVGEMPFEVRRTTANDRFIALFRPQFAFRDGVAPPARTDRVQILELDGSRGTTLLEFPSKSFLVAESSVMPNPFGREGFARLDSADRLHYAWSDSLAVVTYDLSGGRVGRFQAPFTPPPVTRADARDAIDEVTEWVRQRFEPVLADSLPSRWPAIRAFLVDDQDRLWIALAANRGRPTEWVAFSVQGAYLGSVVVPPRNEVRLIRGGRMYAERMDEDDVPSVVIYQIARPFS